MHPLPVDRREQIVEYHFIPNAIANIALTVAALTLGYLGIVGMQNIRFAYTIIDVTKGTIQFLVSAASIHDLKNNFSRIKNTILQNLRIELFEAIFQALLYYGIAVRMRGKHFG